MTTVLVAPTEPKDSVKAFKVVELEVMTSSIPEQHGVDYLLYTSKGTMGFQRKEVPFDFLASVMDGRLTKELIQMQNLRFRCVLGEGKFQFFEDGTLITRPPIPAFKRFRRSSVTKIIHEIRMVKGVEFDYTTDYEDTARYIRYTLDFIMDDKHTGLSTRRGNPSVWGTPSDDDMDAYMLQGFTGILGPVLSRNILDHFGRIPIVWDCTYEQLLEVPGIGQAKAKKLWERLR